MTEIAPADVSARRWLAASVAVVGMAMALFHIYAIAVAPPEAFPFRAIHLAFAVALVFLLYPLRRGDAGRLRPWDAAALVAALATCAYVLILYKSYIFERDPLVDTPTLRDTAFALLCIAMVLEATRRIIGWALPLTAIAFLVHMALFKDIELWRFVNQMYLTTEGIFGQTLGVSASYVLIFVLFGSLMERAGTGQLFMDFALALTGRSAGGPGKVAVVSSSLFGTVSGSAVANVMVDGPITIPLMKRTGFPAHFAAGIEAVASTGGQLMPPIMGAAAFVMAEFLNVAYLEVVIWALVPSFLYYVACFAAVHFQAKRQGLHGLKPEDCPRLWVVLGTRGHLFMPVVVVLVAMFGGVSPMLAALAGAATCVPLIYLRGRALWLPYLLALAVLLAVGGGIAAQIAAGTLDLGAAAAGFEVSGPAVVWACVAMVVAAAAVAAAATGRAGPAFAAATRNFAEGLIEGSKNALSVAMACACAGIVIGTIALTGIGISFTQFVVDLAQDTLWLALAVTAMAGIVLGMGMPTTPAYIIMVSLLVPALVKLGIIIPAAHMFAFYFAIISAITPPVALAVFAAASLAKADIWKAGWAAMRIGAPGFIIPFMFAYEPALMLIVRPGEWAGAVLAVVTATAGCIMLASALFGYLARPCRWWESALLFLAALLLIKPGWTTDAIGLALFGALLVWQVMDRRRSLVAAPPMIAR
ncbi:MAG: TRAP transporter fused permease subunit [Rhodospirillaceae bacterium]|nr:TRAP transporter fused permease subunit [Rhodospirillaceae bacterium]